MIWLAISTACERPRDSRPDSEPVEDAAPEGDSNVDSDVDTEVPEIVAFAEPAEAVDLDPAPAIVHVSLVAAPYTRTLDGQPVDGFAYNAQVPGPTIRAVRGDTIVVDVENQLAEPTTIHWHGVAVPWAMDGVTWMRDPVEAGEAASYTFIAGVAGTFWYHPHFDGALGQVDGGLYGALIVTDPVDPVPDADLVLVIDAGVAAAGGDHAAMESGPWTVNGLVSPTLSLPAGSRVRARVVNASDVGYLDLRWPEPRHIAGDQGLLSALDEPVGGLVLAPGDRADLEWRIGAEPFTLSTAPWSLAGGAALGDPVGLVEVAPQGTAAAPPPLPWAFSGEITSYDPPYTDIVWVLQGDGDAWFINGERYPDVTVNALRLGEVAIIELRNLSSTEHPFHLHGHSFEVLSIDGVPLEVRRIEDTVNVPIRAVVRLRVVADNPGDWMAHCHILPHAHDGMMTVLRVTP